MVYCCKAFASFDWRGEFCKFCNSKLASQTVSYENAFASWPGLYCIYLIALFKFELSVKKSVYVELFESWTLICINFYIIGELVVIHSLHSTCVICWDSQWDCFLHDGFNSWSNKPCNGTNNDSYAEVRHLIENSRISSFT